MNVNEHRVTGVERLVQLQEIFLYHTIHIGKTCRVYSGQRKLVGCCRECVSSDSVEIVKNSSAVDRFRVASGNRGPEEALDKGRR